MLFQRTLFSGDSPRIASAALLSWLCWSGLPSDSLALVRAVALTGEVAPGTAHPFSSFFSPVLNNDGEVAFAAFLDDEDGSFGIWSEGDGIGLLRNVALGGDTAPDSGGAVFDSFDDPNRFLLLNNLGDVAFVATLDDGRTGIFSDRQRPANELVKVALDGDQAPGAADGRNFRFGFGFHAMGGIHSGVAFHALLTPAPAPDNFGSSGVFSEGFAVILDEVAEFAKPAPGTIRPSIGGGPAQFTQLFLPTINDAGYIAFAAETNAGGGSGALGAAGVWSNSPSGTLRPVALAGQTAPGTELEFSIFFGNLSPSFDTSAVINNDGDISFVATLQGSAASGIWVERDGVVEKVAIEGEDAPGTESTFNAITSDALIDDAGNAAFVANLNDGRDGLWKESSAGMLELVAVQGQDAPGTSLEFLNILDFAVNAPGQVAFKAQLSDISSDGIFATDTSGVLRKVVAQGEVLEIDGAQFEIQTLDFIGLNGAIIANGNGTSNGFNDLGQVAFRAEAMNVETAEFFEGILVMDIPVPDFLPGDYNGNNVVDAADYTLWRDNLGSGASLPNDDSPGVGQDDFDRWKTNFGMSAGGGSLSETSSAVPEPVGSLMAAMGALGLMVVRRRRAYMSPVENRSPQVAKTGIYTDVPFCDIVLRGT